MFPRQIVSNVLADFSSPRCVHTSRDFDRRHISRREDHIVCASHQAQRKALAAVPRSDAALVRAARSAARSHRIADRGVGRRQLGRVDVTAQLRHPEEQPGGWLRQRRPPQRPVFPAARSDRAGRRRQRFALRWKRVGLDAVDRCHRNPVLGITFAASESHETWCRSCTNRLPAPRAAAFPRRWASSGPSRCRDRS